MIRVSALRFFLVVSPAPLWMRIALASSAGIGTLTLWLNPADVDSAFGGILLLQMFSASSGYAAASARGYFDPLLIGEATRVRIAAANLLASSLPGITAWAVIVIVAACFGHARSALAPQRLIALSIVSLVAWAAGLALPRMAAGALWGVALVSLALTRTAFTNQLVVMQPAPDGLQGVLTAAGAFLVCPFLLLGDFPAAHSADVLALDLSAACTAASLGFAYVSRREYTLVEPA